MSYFLRILPVFLLIFVCVPALANTANIAMVVNDSAITEAAITDRTRLILTSSGLPNTAENRNNLRPQIIQSLVDEEIRKQEAKRLEFTVSDEEIKAGFGSIAQGNKMTPEQFQAVLNRSGINPQTLFDQIEAQVAWTKVVQSEIRPRIVIRDSDIEGDLSRIQDKIGKTEYLLAEIFLPIENPAEEDKTRNLAEKLVRDMRAGAAPFFRVAQQFSQAAGASNGGNLGWIQQGQLEDALDENIKTLTKDQFTKPIKTMRGYHILYLRDKRTISEDTIPSEAQIRQDIGLERLERQQRQYFLQLKSAAFIENRV